MTKKHLSVSAIELLAKCGEAYRRRYIEDDKRPPGIALIVGSGVDTSVNTNLAHKVTEGHLMPQEAAQEVARDYVEKEMTTREVALTEEESKLGIKKVKGQAADKAVRLAKLHYTHAAPKLNPISTKHIQREIRLEIEGFPFDLLGYIDLQEKGRVRDTKTSGKTPSKNEAEKSLQGVAYTLGTKVLDGEDNDFVMDYLVDTSTPKYEKRAARYTEDDHQKFLNRLERAAEVIEKQAFMPARPGDWWCSRRFCGYADSCPFFHSNQK